MAAAVLSVLLWKAIQEPNQFEEWESPIEDQRVNGEEIETSEGIITAYKSEVPGDDEAVRDVRYVSMSTGNVVRVASDPTALIYQEKPVGDIGRAALIKTGMRGETPVFDFVFVSFPDLNRFTIAREIDALDTTQQLDDDTFSAIVWDEAENARFIIVNARTGTIELARSLDFQISPKAVTDLQDAVEAAAIEAVAAANDAAQLAR
ncbi:hypothetical protein E3U23_05345 [Erythrobacter litoralis]|uniref:hypothetical protein n=1 Tax=Erythrobacter litoralis TaxID=39960 RepID=UPI0024349E35|nr:hypothetical protein [Erythrobacter litoralis]MDG6078617.1 hypothetical protein [Erythrobacter litoralis]